MIDTSIFHRLQNIYCNILGQLQNNISKHFTLFNTLSTHLSMGHWHWGSKTSHAPFSRSFPPSPCRFFLAMRWWPMGCIMSMVGTDSWNWFWDSFGNWTTMRTQQWMQLFLCFSLPFSRSLVGFSVRLFSKVLRERTWCRLCWSRSTLTTPSWPLMCGRCGTTIRVIGSQAFLLIRLPLAVHTCTLVSFWDLDGSTPLVWFDVDRKPGGGHQRAHGALPDGGDHQSSRGGRGSLEGAQQSFG